MLGDLAANRELAADAIVFAAARGASIVVLPELISSGYVFESKAEARACAEAPDGETVTSWARLAAGHGIVIVGGFCEAGGGEVFNSAALVDPGGLRCVYRKAHLWDAESKWFAPGDAAPPVVPTRFGRLAVMICYDLEFPEWVRLPALDGAQLLCAPTNWPASPRPAGERPAEVVRVQADAAVNRMFIAACDRTGTEHPGASAGSAARSSSIRTGGHWPPRRRQPVPTRRSCRRAPWPGSRSRSSLNAASARPWTRRSARPTTCSPIVGRACTARSAADAQTVHSEGAATAVGGLDAVLDVEDPGVGRRHVAERLQLGHDRGDVH